MKDEFPLPVIDIMVDNATGYERMSFIDGFFGYNQIKMHPNDERHTAFRTPLGVFCYTVMPFELKNALVTYQRTMDKIFSKLTVKQSNATSTTLPSRVATKAIIYEILGRCLTS